MWHCHGKRASLAKSSQVSSAHHVQDLHQSYGARRAQQSFSRSLTNAKSAAVREAQERRAAAAVAKAKKGSKR